MKGESIFLALCELDGLAVQFTDDLEIPNGIEEGELLHSGLRRFISQRGVVAQRTHLSAARREFP